MLPGTPVFFASHPPFTGAQATKAVPADIGLYASKNKQAGAQIRNKCWRPIHTTIIVGSFRKYSFMNSHCPSRTAVSFTQLALTEE